MLKLLLKIGQREWLCRTNACGQRYGKNVRHYWSTFSYARKTTAYLKLALLDVPCEKTTKLHNKPNDSMGNVIV